MYCTTLPWRFVWKKTLFSWTCVYMHMEVCIFGQTKTVHIFVHVFICSLQTCTNSFIYIKICICTFANFLTRLSWFQRKSKHILLNSFVFTSSCICIFIHGSSQIHARICVFGFQILHRSKYSLLLSYIYSCRKNVPHQHADRCAQVHRTLRYTVWQSLTFIAHISSCTYKTAYKNKYMYFL